MEEPGTTDNSNMDEGGNGTPSITDIMGNMGAENPEPKQNPENVDEGENVDGQSNQNPKSSFPTWTSQLTEEMRKDADLMNQVSKFPKIGDLAKSYSELEKKLGKSVSLPGDEDSDEVKNAFYEKLGKPKDAAGYKLPKELDQFAEIALKNNLTVAQAKGLSETLTEIGKAQMEENRKAIVRQAKETEEGLKAEYGDKYAEKLNLLQKGVMTYGGPDLGNLLKDTGLLYHPQFVKLFIALGEQAAEAGSYNKGGNGGTNQYKSTGDGGSFTHKGL